MKDSTYPVNEDGNGAGSGVDRPNRDPPGTGQRRLFNVSEEANYSTVFESKSGHLFMRTTALRPSSECRAAGLRQRWKLHSE
jgi:hypothetical protein